MKKNLTELSDEELLQELKKAKQQRIIITIGMGFSVGIAIYNATHYGSLILTIILLIVPFQLSKYSNYESVKKEMESRKQILP